MKIEDLDFGAGKSAPEWTKKQVGRLALRVEDRWYKAYYALPDTLEDAVFLGMVPMAAVKMSDKIFEDFKNLMREIVSNILEERVGTRPSWSGETRGIDKVKKP